MPRPRKSLLERITAADLAYAVDSLVRGGRATVQEIVKYAQERPARIAALERELRALRAGVAGVIAPGPAKATPRAPAPKAAAKRAKPARAKPAPQPVKKRKFTMTPKMKIARHYQGKYLGYLRTADAQTTAAAKKAAKTPGQGVPAAVKILEAARAKKK